MFVNALHYDARRTLEVRGLVARFVDCGLIAATAVAAAKIRFDAMLPDANFHALFVAFAIACSIVLLPLFGVYQSWRGRSMWHLAGRVLLAWLAVQLCAISLMFALHCTNVISRLWFAYWAASAATALIGVRVGVYLVLNRLRHAGTNLRRVALVGHGVHRDAIARNIEASPDSGFRIDAVFNTRAPTESASGNVPTFHDFVDFVAYVREENIEELWLALPLSEEETILRFVEEFREELVSIRLIPDVRSIALLGTSVTHLVGTPAINLAASPMSPTALEQKELFDRFFAAFALLALAPLLVVIAIAVKLSSRGPVFFRQRRQGADGRVFSIYKFRTMHVHRQEQGVVKQATRHDPRITRVGALLRRTSLDELPQFINVLRGEMSVVGPRPHALEHDDLYKPIVRGYIHRYRIKPGITGWAQINGLRGETDRIEKMQSRVEYDLFYLCNWSFAFDIRIIAMTIAKGFIGHNVY